MSRTFGVSRVRDDDEVEAVATVYFVPADRIQPEVIKAWAKTRNVKVESTVNVVEASGLHANRLGRGWLITSIIKITIAIVKELIRLSERYLDEHKSQLPTGHQTTNRHNEQGDRGRVDPRPRPPMPRPRPDDPQGRWPPHDGPGPVIPPRGSLPGLDRGAPSRHGALRYDEDSFESDSPYISRVFPGSGEPAKRDGEENGDGRSGNGGRDPGAKDPKNQPNQGGRGSKDDKDGKAPKDKTPGYLSVPVRQRVK